MIWFTSDTHFGHRNIIEYCGRPYQSVEEMDAALIRNWQDRVAHDDQIVVIGDFALHGKLPYLQDIFAQLPGAKYLIKGNHDSSKLMRKLGWDAVVEGAYTVQTREGPRLYLRHVPYPHQIEERDAKGASVPAGCDYHFCGHVHNGWKRKGNVINVGVDQWDMRPVSLEELIAN